MRFSAFWKARKRHTQNSDLIQAPLETAQYLSTLCRINCKTLLTEIVEVTLLLWFLCKIKWISKFPPDRLREMKNDMNLHEIYSGFGI